MFILYNIQMEYHHHHLPSIGHVVTYPSIEGEFRISEKMNNSPMSMSISIDDEDYRGKGHSYQMIKFLLDSVTTFCPTDRLFIDTEASGFNFWADKLQMMDTYEETGYEYGTTVDKLRRLVRSKCRRHPSLP